MLGCKVTVTACGRGPASGDRLGFVVAADSAAGPSDRVITTSGRSEGGTSSQLPRCHNHVAYIDPRGSISNDTLSLMST